MSAFTNPLKQRLKDGEPLFGVIPADKVGTWLMYVSVFLSLTSASTYVVDFPTLFIVPAEQFERSAPYTKIGLWGQDTCDLTFTDAQLPDEARLGAQRVPHGGKTFEHAMTGDSDQIREHRPARWIDAAALLEHGQKRVLDDVVGGLAAGHVGAVAIDGALIA